jgi:hypothetical protein
MRRRKFPCRKAGKSRGNSGREPSDLGNNDSNLGAVLFVQMSIDLVHNVIHSRRWLQCRVEVFVAEKTLPS